MLSRIKDPVSGTVHFVNPAHAGYTLCSRSKGCDLLGNSFPPGEKTEDCVTCADCAKVICAVRNEPYNTLVAEVEDNTLMTGIYDAVKPPTEHIKGKESENEHCLERPD